MENKRDSFLMQGIKKLNKEELAATMSIMNDIAVLQTSKSSKKKPKISAAIKAEIAAKMKLREFNGWMAADGSVFDNWGDYMRHQWDVDFGNTPF